MVFIDITFQQFLGYVFSPVSTEATVNIDSSRCLVGSSFNTDVQIIFLGDTGYLVKVYKLRLVRKVASTYVKEEIHWSTNGLLSL